MAGKSPKTALQALYERGGGKSDPRAKRRKGRGAGGKARWRGTKDPRPNKPRSRQHTGTQSNKSRSAQNAAQRKR